VQRQRAAFIEARQECDPSALLVVDDSGRHQALARADGRAPRGPRAPGAKPVPRGRHVTMVGAWGLVGVVAAMMVAGLVDGAALLAFVQEVLGPPRHPGQVVRLDHLKAHQVAGVREAIAAVGGRRLDLPPDSPDVSPSEAGWSQNQGDVADESRTDAGAPLGGKHGGVCGDHQPGCPRRVYACG